MKKILIVLFFIISSNKTISSDFEVGLGTGINWTYQKGSIADQNLSLSHPLICDCYKNFTFNNALLDSFPYSFHFKYKFGNNLKLGFDFVYNSGALILVKEGEQKPIIAIDSSDGRYDIDTLTQITTNNLKIIGKQLNINLHLDYQATDRLWISFGPSFFIYQVFKYERTINIISPMGWDHNFNHDQFNVPNGDERLYENYNTTYVASRKEIPNYSKINFGLNFGLEYEIPFWGIKFVPFLQGGIRLTQPMKGTTWNYYSIYSGFKFTYNI